MQLEWRQRRRVSVYENWRDQLMMREKSLSLLALLILGGCHPQLPSIPAMKRSIRRVRLQWSSSFHSARSDCVLSHSTILPHELEFPCHDSKGDKDPMIVFRTLSNINFLMQIRHWYADKTFTSCPSPFSQLYTIYEIDSALSISLMYAFLPNKRKETYIRRMIFDYYIGPVVSQLILK